MKRGNETMTSTDEVSGPTSSKKPRESREFPKVKSYELLEKRYGTVVPDTFPVRKDDFFRKDGPHAARNFTIDDIDFTTKAALLQLLSRPVMQARLLDAGTGNRAKPLHMFLYALLEACRHGNLIISAEGLEGEQDDSDSDSEEEEEEGEGEEGEEEGECCTLRVPCTFVGCVLAVQVMRNWWYWSFFRSPGRLQGACAQGGTRVTGRPELRGKPIGHVQPPP